MIFEEYCEFCELNECVNLKNICRGLLYVCPILSRSDDASVPVRTSNIELLVYICQEKTYERCKLTYFM